jgi:hypothetical protein
MKISFLSAHKNDEARRYFNIMVGNNFLPYEYENIATFMFHYIEGYSNPDINRILKECLENIIFSDNDNENKI